MSIQNPVEVLFLIPGQGVFLFEYSGDERNNCSFTIMNKDQSDGILIEWATDGVNVTRANSIVDYTDPTNSRGLINKSGAFYWFSLDAQHQALYAGQGEARQETKVYEYTLPYLTDDERKANKAFLESLVVITDFQQVAPLRLLHNPVAQNVPFHVTGSTI